MLARADRRGGHRPSLRRRGTCARLLLAVVACVVVVPAAARAARAPVAQRVAPVQQIIAVLNTHGVRAHPFVADDLISSVHATRPLTGERTELPLLGQTIDRRGRAWLRVRLPGRTLGQDSPPRVGWISAAHTLRSDTPWHLVVDLAARRVTVFRDGRAVRTFSAIVGKPSTPTPRGEYFVEENVKLPADQPGAPFALATSNRSDVLQEFDGGPGQIALHGLDHVGGDLGTAESHGCIRLADSAITWLAARIAPGVPITVV